MDIAKIRKKAQSKEKEKKAEEMLLPQPAEQPIKETVASASSEALPGHAGDTQKSEEPPGEIKEETICSPEKGSEDTRNREKEQKEVKHPVEAGKSGQYESEEHAEDLSLELLTFSLSKEEFAFRVSEIEEIIRFQKITTVPTMPGYVLGITSLRGKIIPVLDLKTRLGIRKNTTGADPDDAGTSVQPATNTDEKILIVSGPKGLIGATIDRVIGVVRFPREKMLEPPAHLTEAELRFIEGVVIFEKRFISIIRSEDTMNIEAD